MPTLSREQTDSFSPNLAADSIEDLIGKMTSSDVHNFFVENGQQPAAVFATTDPAVIQVLRGLFEEANDLSAFFKAPSNS